MSDNRIEGHHFNAEMSREPDPLAFYSDERGLWDEESLWLAAESAEIVDISIDHPSLQNAMNEVVTMSRADFADIARRAMNRGIVPILIDRDTGRLVDGFHRLMKATILGLEVMEAKFIEMPKRRWSK